ncbi:MAG: hypothetical protein FJY73_03130 [Candidatus Eisenbacteria bacterium]|nr:hypothetical protein [Candidatus Eisenbacteria bacterium]
MRRVLSVQVLLFVLALSASADIPNRTRVPVLEGISLHDRGAASGTCSIVYYNLCSRWLWVWSGWEPGDEVGVVFDLPADCGALPNEVCTNTEFWWYWRYTTPGWGYTITFNLYRVDEEGCKVGASLATIPRYDPSGTHYPGPLVFPEVVNLTGRVAITAMWDKGTLPYLATDNNAKNLAAPLLCPGYSPSPAHSFSCGGMGAPYCPPLPFEDAHGPVQILMEASFECRPVIGTAESSWSAVKTLFR